MPNSDLVTLKIELGILDDKLELALKYRTQLEAINSNNIALLRVVPVSMIKTAIQKERKILEDYLCLEKLINDISGNRKTTEIRENY